MANDGARPGVESVPAPLAEARIWTADQIALQAWLALPSAVRAPRSHAALAAQLGIHEITLYKWKRLPGFAEAVYALAREELKAELVPVLHAQVAQAKKGSLPHAQWLFELASKRAPKQRHEHGGAAGAPLTIRIETIDDRAQPQPRP
jgi:hypothetical protein